MDAILEILKLIILLNIIFYIKIVLKSKPLHNKNIIFISKTHYKYNFSINVTGKDNGIFIIIIVLASHNYDFSKLQL